MLTAMRNRLFIEKARLIHEVMQRNYRMLKACQMEEEDVYQSLSLRLLEALQAYDSGINPNLDAYLRGRLWNTKYSIWLCPAGVTVSLTRLEKCVCRSFRWMNRKKTGYFPN